MNNTTLQYSPIQESDEDQIIAIFNYYIEHSYAAFLEERVPLSFFQQMRTDRRYPSVVARDGAELIGFGMLRPHNPMPAFTHTAEIASFIRHEDTGKGIGTEMLRYLEEKGGAIGISRILAQISSRNEGSIRFHQRNGFQECGRFHQVGMKHNLPFDTVWMEKAI